MKKYLYLVILAIFINASFVFAQTYDISQINSIVTYNELGWNVDINLMDTVLFGNYNGLPIEWIILKKENGKARLMAKNSIIKLQYDINGEDIDYEDCSLRKWLNGEFYNNAFNDSEKNMIIRTNIYETVNNERNERFLYDNVALLVHSEYFSPRGGEATITKDYGWTVDSGNQGHLHKDTLELLAKSSGKTNYDYSNYQDWSVLDYENVKPVIWINYNLYSQSINWSSSNVKNGWVGNSYYRNNVKAINEWIQYGSDLYYVGGDGLVLTNQWIGNYYVDSTGKMLVDTITPDGYYVGKDGKKVVLNSNIGNNKITTQNTNTASGTLSTKGNNNKEFNENQIIVTSNEIDGIYYIDEGEDTRIVVNFDANGSKKIKAATERNLNKYLYVVADNDYTIAVKVDKVVSNGTATVFLPSYYRNNATKAAIEAVHKKQIFAYIAEDASRVPASSLVGTMTENSNDKFIANNYKASESGKSNGGLIIGMPTREAELKNDDHFYLNNNMQRDTWVYHKTYYYHVDDSGNIQKNQWIELRYVGSDGRMYRGRQTPDGHWVGDNGLVVDIHQDLYNSTLVEAAESDSWYRTKSGLWYYFENDRTTTKKGWFKDKSDDQWYYLNPETGIMQVGWANIDGKYYYFNESHNNETNWYETGNGFFESFGKKVKAYGSMFKNEKTPDGYWVNENGEYVEKNNQLMTNIIILLGSLFGLIAALVLITVIKIKNNNKAINNNEKA